MPKTDCSNVLGEDSFKYKNIKKILVANRGEISRRILRSIHSEGLESVSIYAFEDRNSAHVKEAGEAVELSGSDPISAYMDVPQIIDICKRTGANAIHPGYGFLSENSGFARQVVEAGLIFVGPDPKTIELMGDKVRSREFASKHNCPIAPSVVQTGTLEEFKEETQKIVGYPLLIKASAGGGGKGMTIVDSPADFSEKARLASSEAERYFGDPRIYAEKYLQQPRHIEVQVLGDGKGNVVHLYERECSIQRRFQKVVEESPAPNLNAATRKKLIASAVSLASAANYLNAGTVEFVVDGAGEFFFLEMNTRLQVEHPVTELVTSIDLVVEQLRIADTGVLSFKQSDVSIKGHAIECRISAEEPDHDFRPAIGKILKLKEPQGKGIRIDAGVQEGQSISPTFDPMISKLIVFGDSREEACARLEKALSSYVILGLPTNINFLQQLVDCSAFLKGVTTTSFISENRVALNTPEAEDVSLDAAAVIALLSQTEFHKSAFSMIEPYASIGAWRN
ncbi:MAG: biotin carboxylase N-terminal domain-containing protein [Pseudomonas marincola]